MAKQSKSKKVEKSAKAPKSNISFPQWVSTVARARGGEKAPAVVELAKLRAKCPEYKDAKMYAKNFPNAFKRYEQFCARPQSKAA